MAKSRDVPYKASETFLNFAFDPYKFIEEGIKIAEDNNLRLAPQSNVTSGSRVSGKNYNWYGYDASSTLSIEQQFNINSGLGSFLDQDLINDIETSYSNIVAKLDLGGDLKASRIKFTDRPLGVFSFAQASKGLIRPVEYYSIIEDKVIDADSVFRGVLNEGETNEIEYFYYLKEGQEVLVEKRQEGTTEMLKNCNTLVPKLDEFSKLVLPYDSNDKIVNSCNGYRLRFTSTIKKVYAYREKKGGGTAPYVDIYLATGQNAGFDPEQMIIQAMPNILLARVLEKSGVKVRMFGFFNQNIDYDSVNKFYMIKNYGEPTDINKITVFLADTRFFRYWLFNASTGWNYRMTGKPLGGSDGYMMNTVRFNREIMPFVRNYVDYQIKTGKFPSQVVNKKLMIFGGMELSSGQRLMDNTTQEQIMRRFYSLSDYVQLQLSKTPKKVMQDIIKREKDAGKTSSQIENYLSNSITDVLTPTQETTKTAPNDKMTESQLRVASQLDTQEASDEIMKDRKNLLDILKTLMQ
jgi:hypothetical protein